MVSTGDTRGIAKLSDRELVALTELRMEPEADRRLSDLLDQQQAGEVSDLERAELAALMRTYEVGLLRQSQALAEAVHRGLLPPLGQVEQCGPIDATPGPRDNP